MKKLVLAVSLGIIAACVLMGGCSRTRPDGVDPAAPAEPELTAEETARVMLEALKTGDVDAFLAYADLRGIYKRFPAEMRKTFSFEQFKNALKTAEIRVDDTGLNELKDLAYEILGVEKRGGCQVVTFRTRTAPGRSWKVWEAYFQRFDDVWKITGKGVRRLRTED